MRCLFRTVRPPRPASAALSLLTAFAALCLGSLPRPAHAAAVTYDSSAKRTVNAGIILLRSTDEGNGRGPGNKDPYLFHILNQRLDIRPFGWTITNPLAPASVTQEIASRWNARSGAGGPQYGVGQTVTPGMAAYWEVDLRRTTSDDLGQLDVLFLPIDQGRTASFSVADSQKLLQFVDGGGTLVIEYEGYNTSAAPPIDQTAHLFFPLQFSGTTPGGGRYAVLPTGRQPLITTPYFLSEAELNGLGDKRIGDYYAYDGTSTSSPPGPTLLGTVIGNSGNQMPVVAAGQLGAGEIIVSTLGFANAINERVQALPATDAGVGANSGPYCGPDVQNAPTQDLKFLSNILAAAGAHAHERQNSRQNGNALNGVPSATLAWSTSGQLAGAVTTPAINGNYVYVTSGTRLRAFDLYPSENLDGDPSNNPDDDTQGGANADYSQGKEYDQVWSVDVGQNASAPTVAPDPVSGGAAVMVEAADGSVRVFDGAKGTELGISPLSGSGGRGGYSSPAPAPTYYNGCVYAGGANGSLYVYNFKKTSNQSAVFGLDPTGSAGSAVAASPSVGVIEENGVSDVVALVTTGQGMYSVFLGARGEKLTGPVASGYNTKLAALPNGRMDIDPTTSALNPFVITDPSTGYPSAPSPTPTPKATGPNFTGYTAANPPLWADYDADLSASAGITQNGPLTRTVVGVSSSKDNSLASAGTVSAPAMGRDGNAYYTVNNVVNGTNYSAIFCVHDAAGTPQILWRFRLPTILEAGIPVVDAEGTNYTNPAAPNNGLANYHFVGAPSVDSRGLVYALATNGTNSAVLCFNGSIVAGQSEIYTDAPGVGTNNLQISQPLLTDPTTDEFGNTTPPGPAKLNTSQYTINTDGRIIFRNFGTTTGGGTKQLYPNLNEPFPITVQVNSTNQNVPPQPPRLVPIHTNLVWYTVIPGVVANSALTKVNTNLFFVDTGGILYKVFSDPATAGLSITSKEVLNTGDTKMYTNLGDTGVGAGATPASANGVMLVNGPNGVSAFANQVTLVADNNRIMEVDADGNAMWSVDATTRTTVEGGDVPVYYGGTQPTNPGKYVTTTLELNRPRSITELNPNDYLVADTGNNRCVRFDRGGKVIWELNKFNGNGLLGPGEPDTLNQPTSVQIRSAQLANGNTVVAYLISDTGNFRVLELDDVYDKNFNLLQNHILTWVSHTHDAQARQYRYHGASWFYAPNGKQYVVALVTNVRVAPFTRTSTKPLLGQLAPASQDAPGGSVVLLDYDSNPANAYGKPGFGSGGQASGFVAIENTGGNTYTLDVINSIQAPLLNNGTGGFDVTGGATGTPSGGSSIVTLPLRNPRYLKAYVPSGGQNTDHNFLIADDNGVFDLKLNGGIFRAFWGFTQADYHAIKTPIDQAGVTGRLVVDANGNPVLFTDSNGKSHLQYKQMEFNRNGLPFVPVSVQRTGSQTFGVNGPTIGKYLIATGFAQGEVGTNYGDVNGPLDQNGVPPPPGFGGEVFEVDPVPNGGGFQMQEPHFNLNGSNIILVPGLNGWPPPQYTGHTISRPSNTGPVTQPAFAYRAQ